MVGLAGPGPGLEKEELRAQQADALGSLLQRLPNLGDAGRVGQHREPPPVAGLGRLLPPGDGLHAGEPAAGSVLLRGGEAIRKGVANQLAAGAVDNHRLAVGDLQQLQPEADHHGDAERPRHDRGVSGDAATGERHAPDLAAQLGDVGRPQVGRDQHPARVPDPGSKGRGGGPPSQAADVVGALREQLVREASEPVGDRLRRLAESAGRGPPLLEDQGANSRFQAGITRHQAPRFDDVRLRRAAFGAQPGGQLFELIGGVFECPAGALELFTAVLRRNLLIYGLGGVIVPFIGIKIVDLILTGLQLTS